MKNRKRAMPRRAERSAPRSRRPRRGRASHLPMISAFRIKAGLVVLTGLCLTLALSCLERIGPPPALRWDALWVHQHRELVRIGILSLLVAAASTVLLVMTRRAKWWALSFWIIAAALAWSGFSDRLPTLIRVVWEHSGPAG